MSRTTFHIAAAFIYAVFGIGLLAAPGPFMAPFGLSFDAAGELIARVCGSALLGFAIVLALSRKADAAGDRPLMVGGLVYNLIDLPVNLIGLQHGVLSGMAWISIALHLGLAAGFAWFLRLNRS